VAFLRLAYAETAHRPNRLLIIEIRASQTGGEPATEPASRAPLFQWIAPALTILNVRDAAQRRHNRMLLDLLASDLAHLRITLNRVVFQLSRRDVPLSWHLTAAQRADIEAAWRTRFARSAEAAEVAALIVANTTN